MRVILDTNVVVAAMRSHTGASAKLLEMLSTGIYTIALSAPLAFEYEEVLVRELVPAIATLADVDAVIRFLCDVSEKYDPGRSRHPMGVDPDDEFVLELAAQAGVDYIVTHNIRHFATATASGINAVLPAHFLALVKG